MPDAALPLRERLDAVHSEYPLKLLKELIAIPSETPTGNVREIMVKIEQDLRAMGFEIQVVAKKPEKPNVIGTYNAGGTGPSVVLYAHADCAAVSEANLHLWKTDPYGGEIIDGYMYGNGSADAKSGIAALMGACKAIIDAKIPLAGKIIFIATADGEVGDLEGAKWMYENGLIPKADYGINGDGSNLEIQHVFRGRAFFSLDVEGKVSHSNSPWLGINAISKMAKVIAALDNFTLTYTPHPIVPRSSHTVTTIGGGTKHNSLPGQCNATLDVRLVPGQTIAGAQAEFEGLLDRLRAEDPELKVKLELMEFGAREVVEFPADCRVVVEAGRAFEDLTGRKASFGAGFGSTGCVDYFAKLGTPSLFFGPANIKEAHQPDERCSVENLDIATRVAALAVARIVSGQD